MQFPLINRAVFAVLTAALCIGGARSAAAQAVTIPADTVVWVTLDEPLSSENARLGQRVTATISPMDRCGLPTNTRFIGLVTMVDRPTAARPAMLDVDWVAVRLPGDPEITAVPGEAGARLAGFGFRDRRPYRRFDGGIYPIGSPYTYRDYDGRFYRDYRWRDDHWRDRRWRDRDWDDDDDFDPAWIGYGAGAGALIGALSGGSFLSGALLGGLGGAAFEWIRSSDIFTQAEPGGKPVLAAFQRDRQQMFHDVRLPRSEPFGILVRRPFSFDQNERYRYASLDDARRAERVMGMRQELYNTTSVRVNGRRVDFGDRRPMFVNGTLYYPLSGIEGLTGMRADHRLGRAPATGFVLNGGRETIFVVPSQDSVRVGTRTYPMRHPVMTVNGETYVPVGFLARTGEFRERWDPQKGELDIERIR